MGEKKIKGINKFLYRGYEVYDEEKDREDKQMNASEVKEEVVADAVQEETKKVPLGKRNILDDVFEENKSRDVNAYWQLKQTPLYAGLVDRKPYKVTITDTAKIGKGSLIDRTIRTFNYITLDDEHAGIKYESGFVKTHPDIVRFIKACVTTQYCESAIYSDVVGSFVKQILSDLENGGLQLPVTMSYSLPVQEIILRELNEFFTELCDKNDVKYYAVIESKPKKGKKKTDNPLMEAAYREIID